MAVDVRLSDPFGIEAQVCGGKVPHRGADFALAAARWLAADLERKQDECDYVAYYPCCYCPRWHVGVVGGSVEARLQRQQQRLRERPGRGRAPAPSGG